MNKIPLEYKIAKNLRMVYEILLIDKDKVKSEEYVMNKLKDKGIKVTKSNGVELGKPDFECMFGEIKFYVEVKSSDGLRKSQLKWILDNPKKIIYLYYLDQRLKATPQEALNEYQDKF